MSQVDKKNDDDTNEVSKPWELKFLSWNFSTMPCFRKSYITGFSTAIGGGLLYFVATSKVSTSFHVAFGSFWAGFFCYWIPCRIKYENAQRIVKRISKSESS